MSRLSKKFFCSLFVLFTCLIHCSAQANFNFDFSNNGQRVCLADASVTLSPASVTIHFLDAGSNTTQATNVYRRHLYGSGTDWVQVAANIPAGTASWTDNNVTAGDVWEYQLKRPHGASFSTDYLAATVGYDQSGYRGRMILLVADNIVNNLPAKYTELKKDLTGDGWLVQELIVPRAAGWDSGDTVITIRNQVQNIYNSAPAGDKPKLLFILGHVPVPRSGLGGQTPDDHIQNAGARGADTYYADIDGVYTDVSSYNPGGLSSPYAVNLPGDYKWDQDNIPSELEMGFGRIDFSDIVSYLQTETFLTDQYLTRLHHYKQADAGFIMGTKTGFYFGYDNSNDGSYRSLPAISGANNVYQNTSALPHPQWVQQNGPFAFYMQNRFAPQIGEWNTYGMNAAVYSSDQSYWGFGDVPEGNQYSTIRSILCANSKCVMAIWTTMAINVFHQAGAGEPMGLVCKQIMDHNTGNQKIEKPSSPYDTPLFWNRTQFDMYGDPSVRLMQTIPPSNLSGFVLLGGGGLTLSWTASTDNNIVGYHVYKASSEFGKYTRLTTVPVTGTHYNVSALAGDWLMVRAIKQQATGSGLIFNPSQGIFFLNTLNAIPVKLFDFTATKEKQTALLKWTTASESNNSGCVIERSADGIQWKKIGFENSKALNGNSSISLDYSFTDLSPLAGKNYYRLRTISQSGSDEMSEIRLLIFDERAQFNIAPNPVHDLLTITNTAGTCIISTKIFDLSGRLLKSAGSENILHTTDLLPGIYFLCISTADGGQFRERFIKE